MGTKLAKHLLSRAFLLALRLRIGGDSQMLACPWPVKTPLTFTMLTNGSDPPNGVMVDNAILLSLSPGQIILMWVFLEISHVVAAPAAFY